MHVFNDERTEEPPLDLWLKVTRLRERHWAALIEASAPQGGGPPGVRIDFFDDDGLVFDTLSYPSVAQAEHALYYNGFIPLSEQPDSQAVAGPPPWPLRHRLPLASPVYSSGQYWLEPANIGRMTHRRPRTSSGLQHFVEAQADVMETVLSELRAGRKRTHWMWFVFPQIKGLGRSVQSVRYAIVDLAHARRYLSHPILGPRLRQCFELVLQHRQRSAEHIFGQVDARKFHSCATLFDIACGTGDSVFAQALRVFFGGEPDPSTIERL